MTNNFIPFTAAIFDLDGTVLDSMGVWRDVDAAFFLARGIELDHAEYARAVQGMSFREAAVYTVGRFGLDESVESVMAEWMQMTREEYAHHVLLKPGARDYLRMLKRSGVKLAVATANRHELFMPALARGGVAKLFDEVCTCADAGDTGKANGALFALAAARLGVAPGECAVFEDTLEGIVGAKAAGMRAYAVKDVGFMHHPDEIAALADGVIDDFAEMARFHDIPPARRCAIFTARCDGDMNRAYAPMPGDYVLCADAGWELARRAGVKPDLVIGDFDSSGEPSDERTERAPVDKADTDTMLCLKKGLSMGFDDFLIVGGFGGRFDHTLANIQTLHYAAARQVRAVMCDGLTWATAVKAGSVRVNANVLGEGAKKLSVFALSEVCRGVEMRGVKYRMEDYAEEDGTLTGDFPLGVSNEFAGEFAEISVKEGVLLVTVCGE